MDMKTEKEELIIRVINDGADMLKKTQDDHEEMIQNYRENGFGKMHPGNIESYKTGLHYTHGYTIGHLVLLEKINELISMTPEEIKKLIAENEKISAENKKHLDEVFDRVKKTIKNDGKDN